MLEKIVGLSLDSSLILDDETVEMCAPVSRDGLPLCTAGSLARNHADAAIPVNLLLAFPAVPDCVLGREGMTEGTRLSMVEPGPMQVDNAGYWLEMSRIHASPVKTLTAAATGLIRRMAEVIKPHAVRDGSDEVLVSPSVSDNLPPIHIEGVGVAVIVEMPGPKPASIVSLLDKAEESFFGGQKASVVVTLCEHWKVVLSGVMRRAVSAAPPRFILRDSLAPNGVA